MSLSTSFERMCLDEFDDMCSCGYRCASVTRPKSDPSWISFLWLLLLLFWDTFSRLPTHTHIHIFIYIREIIRKRIRYPKSIETWGCVWKHWVRPKLNVGDALLGLQLILDRSSSLLMLSIEAWFIVIFRLLTLVHVVAVHKTHHQQQKCVSLFLILVLG